MNKFEQSKQIAAGLTHFLRKKMHIASFEIEEMAHRRFEVCKLCPERNIEENKCKKCGCFLNLKTRSMESQCPLEYWRVAINQ